MPLATPKTWTGVGKTPGPAVGTDFEATGGLVGTNPPTYVDAGGGDIEIDFAQLVAGTQSGMVRHNTAGDSAFFQLTYDITFAEVATAAHEASQGRILAGNAKRISVLHNIASGANTVLVRGWTTTDAVLDGTGGTGLPVWTAGIPVALGTPYRVQMAAERGASTTTGKMKARLVRLTDSTQLAEGEDWAFDFGATGAWSHHQTGKVGTAGNAPFRIDNIGFSDQAYAYLASPEPAPVVTPPATPTGTVHRLGWDVRLGGDSL